MSMVTFITWVPALLIVALAFGAIAADISMKIRSIR